MDRTMSMEQRRVLHTAFAEASDQAEEALGTVAYDAEEGGLGLLLVEYLALWERLNRLLTLEAFALVVGTPDARDERE